jgi:hypothetical protein
MTRELGMEVTHASQNHYNKCFQTPRIQAGLRPELVAALSLLPLRRSAGTRLTQHVSGAESPLHMCPLSTTAATAAAAAAAAAIALPAAAAAASGSSP